MNEDVSLIYQTHQRYDLCSKQWLKLWLGVYLVWVRNTSVNCFLSLFFFFRHLISICIRFHLIFIMLKSSQNSNWLIWRTKFTFFSIIMTNGNICKFTLLNLFLMSLCVARCLCCLFLNVTSIVCVYVCGIHVLSQRVLLFITFNAFIVIPCLLSIVWPWDMYTIDKVFWYC